MKKALFSLFTLWALFPGVAQAHCPLCTVGAGVLALGAAYLGVNTYVVGIWIGAFALALGLWLSRFIKRRYLPHQRPLLTGVIFLSTILPLLPLLQHYTSLNIYWFGEYGSWFNKTYLVNRFLVGSLAGAFLMHIAPFLSRLVSGIRQDRVLPYQSMAITFLLLFGASLIVQFVL